MTYSIDLRAKAVAFVQGGGSKSEAARIFGVSRPALYSWLGAQDLTPRQRGVPRKRKIDRAALLRDVELSPDSLLKERAARFGVHISSMAYALGQLKIGRKKNLPIFSRIIPQPE
jgi:transposase